MSLTCWPTMSAMELFANNWPALIVVLGIALLTLGLIRKLVKLAFFGVVVGVISLIIWPMIS